MKTYGLTLALLLGLSGSLLAQATSNAAPSKIVAEVSSAPPLGTTPNRSGAKTPPPKTEAKAVPKADAKTDKPRSADTTGKAKPTAATEPKTETKATVPAAPTAVTEARPGAEQLPFKLNDRTESLPPPPSLTGLLLRTFGALLFIVGLIAAAGWALRYFGIVSFGKAQTEPAGLKVMNTVPLGERRSLLLVRFGERTLLVGATPQGLTLLAEQNDDVEAQGNYGSPVRTVTDMLGVRSGFHFEEEMARAALPNNSWRKGSAQQ